MPWFGHNYYDGPMKKIRLVRGVVAPAYTIQHIYAEPVVE